MGKKRINRNQRQLYSTPLPLPGLVQDGSVSTSQGAEAAAEATAGQVACKGWTPLETLVELLRGVISQVTRRYKGDTLPSSTAIAHANTRNPQQSFALARAEFHPHGEAVWITDPECMQRIFRQGFFGKGTLSRSEASWKSRQVEKLQGAASPILSLEDITRKRRIERAAIKEEKRAASASGSSQVSGESSPVTFRSLSTPASPLPCSAPASPLPGSPSAPIQDIDIDSLESVEHLQLSLEEAFFLVFAVEAIAVYHASEDVRSTNDMPLTIRECWALFAQASRKSASADTPLLQQPSPIGWDNPFIIRYVAYHHFRSHGWVVKDGLKYGVDFLLYRKGVVFGHSEFAVKVLYGASQSSTDSSGHSAAHSLPPSTPRVILGAVNPWHRQTYSWQWVLNLNRVVSQVQKTLLFCHVTPPRDTSCLEEETLLNPRLALPQYTVVEVTSRRWIPERNRA